MRLRWFGGKGRIIESLKIINSASFTIEESKVALLQLEVTYESGLPDTYQLALAFGKENFAFKLEENCPKAVIAKIENG